MSWNPMDTVRDVGNFAYQNTGADNFMNIARGVRGGTLNYNPMNFSDPNSFWGNAVSGLGEAGLMFLPGGGAVKAGMVAGKSAGLLRAGVKAGTKAAAPKTYFTQIAKTAGQTGVKGATKTGVKRGAAMAVAAPVFNAMLGTQAMAAPMTSSNRSGSPAGSYNRTGVAPTMDETGQAQAAFAAATVPGVNGVSGSYLTPQEASYYNSAASQGNSAATSQQNLINQNLLDVIGGLNRRSTGAGLDLQAMAADYGMATSPQVDVGIDYIRQAGAQGIAGARKDAAQQLADAQMQRAQAANQAALARYNAEQQAKWAIMQRAYGG
jgi:hypothetical protein